MTFGTTLVRRAVYNVCHSPGLPRPLKMKAVVPSKRRDPIYPVTGRHISTPPPKGVFYSVFIRRDACQGAEENRFRHLLTMFIRSLLVIAVQ
jgi:hypothetical protein